MAKDIGSQTRTWSYFKHVIAQLDSLEGPRQNFVSESFLPEVGLAEPSVEFIHRFYSTPHGRAIACSNFGG